MSTLFCCWSSALRGGGIVIASTSPDVGGLCLFVVVVDFVVVISVVVMVVRMRWLRCVLQAQTLGYTHTNLTPREISRIQKVGFCE